MKKVAIALVFLALPFFASADTLVCPAGQVVQTVEVTPAVVGTPAVTHTVHHEAVTHEEVVIDTPAYDTYVYVGFHQGDYLKLGNGNYLLLPHHLGSYNKVHHEAVTHTEIVVDASAYDEVVIDVPEVIATPAVTEDQCVDAPVTPDPTSSTTPATTPTTPAVSSSSSSQPGGHRHCGTYNTPSCAEWVKTLVNTSVSASAGTSTTTPSTAEQQKAIILRIISLMRQLIIQLQLNAGTPAIQGKG